MLMLAGLASLRPVTAQAGMESLGLNFGAQIGKTYRFKTRLPGTKKRLTVLLKINNVDLQVNDGDKILTVQIEYKDKVPKLTKKEVSRIVNLDYYPDYWYSIIDGQAGQSFEDVYYAVVPM